MEEPNKYSPEQFIEFMNCWEAITDAYRRYDCILETYRPSSSRLNPSRNRRIILPDPIPRDVDSAARSVLMHLRLYERNVPLPIRECFKVEASSMKRDAERYLKKL